MTNLSPVAKAVVAFIIGAVLFVANLLVIDNGHWTAHDTAAILSWLGTTLGVYLVPNKGTTDTTGTVV
jgi:uncharacterized membrane protein YdcZ (DUF606 family)